MGAMTWISFSACVRILRRPSTGHLFRASIYADRVLIPAVAYPVPLAITQPAV
jgi:hypothetical protein